MSKLGRGSAVKRTAARNRRKRPGIASTGGDRSERQRVEMEAALLYDTGPRIGGGRQSVDLPLMVMKSGTNSTSCGL
jgi:hypothetical protein